MSKSRSSALVLLLTGITACGSDSSKGASASIAFEDLPEKYAEAACAAYQACYGSVFNLFLNGMDCVQLMSQRFENGTFALVDGKIAEGTVVYDGSKAQACLDAVRQLDCTALMDRDPPACLVALDGTIPLGGDCDLNEECAGSARCQSSSGTCPGKCVPLLSAGQACTADGDCNDGLLCSAETKLCVKPAVAGEACEYGSPPCATGLLCLGKDDTLHTPGSCQSATAALKGADGDTCDPTAGNLCQTGVSCVADGLDLAGLQITWKCVTIGTYKAGEDCKPGIPEACSSGNYCKTLLNPLSGTCAAVPDAKQACGTGYGAQCKTGAVCVHDVCENYASNGVSCTGNAMCYSEYCGPSGGCEPRLPCK
jgi:hypothetical protein